MTDDLKIHVYDANEYVLNINTNKPTDPNIVYILLRTIKLHEESVTSNFGYAYVLPRQKLKQIDKPTHYIYVLYNSANTTSPIKKHKIIRHRSYIEIYLYYKNNWCRINIGGNPGNNAPYFAYEKSTDDTVRFTKPNSANLTGLNLIFVKDINKPKLTYISDEIIGYEYNLNDYPKVSELNPNFNTIKYDNTYANFIKSIQTNDFRLKISPALTNQIFNALNFIEHSKTLIPASAEITKINIFPTDNKEKREIVVTDFNDPNIHINLAYYDKAINFFCQLEIIKAIITAKKEKNQNAELKGGAGTMGGHAGAFCFKDNYTIIYKKYSCDTIDDGEYFTDNPYKLLQRVSGNDTEENADRELLFYWRLLKLYKLSISDNVTDEFKSKYTHVLNLYEHSSLPLLSDPNVIKLIADNDGNVCDKPEGINKSFKKGYELGNMFRLKATTGSTDTFMDNKTRGVIDFKVGSYTKLLVDKKLNDDITYEESDLPREQVTAPELHAGGSKQKTQYPLIAKNLKVIAQLILDANSTSHHYGFRCEALGDPVMPLFFGDKQKDDSYLGSETNIFRKNKKKGLVSELYSDMDPITGEDKILNHKHNKQYYTLNKPVIYTNLEEIYNGLYNKLHANIANPNVLAHFLHINPFNMDNAAIINFVHAKEEKLLNRPLYSLPPILTLYTFLSKFSDEGKKTYWDKLYAFINEVFIAQYADYIILTGNEKCKTQPQANECHRTFYCFVGSSIMMRYESSSDSNSDWPTENLKFFLSDFGHPYMFDKTFNDATQQNYIADLDFIFKNFIYGGLGFLYMNYLALVALHMNFDAITKNNIKQIETYLHKLINELLLPENKHGNNNSGETIPNDLKKISYTSDKAKEAIFTLIQPQMQELTKYITEKNRLVIDDKIYKSKYDITAGAEPSTD